jgi:hypothetical protein
MPRQIRCHNSRTCRLLKSVVLGLPTPPRQLPSHRKGVSVSIRSIGRCPRDGRTMPAQPALSIRRTASYTVAPVLCRPLTFILSASLLLCTVSGAMWARSYFAIDALFCNASRGDSYSVTSCDGIAQWSWELNRPILSDRRAWAIATVRRDDPEYSTYRALESDIGTGSLPLLMTATSVAFPVPSGYRFGFLRTPYWLLFACSSAIPLIWLGKALGRRRLRLNREQLRLCIECGYDVRATSERCPECGLTCRSAQA